MWFFSRKTRTDIRDIIADMTDTHSHILWGVDDGSKSEEQTLEMLRLAQELGIKRGFCTPHIMANLPKNRYEKLTGEFDMKLSSENSFQTRLAAEYMLDENFMKLLESEKLLTYDDKHVLVEMSHLGAPSNLHAIIFEIINNGYTPVLAHPERYSAFISDEQYKLLKEYGCRFQLNILSLGETYGTRSSKKARELLEQGCFDFIGSDMHTVRMVNAISTITLSKNNEARVKELVLNNNELWK